MGIFSKSNAGGFMDVIRCDEPSYLVWKWHPAGSQLGKNYRENAIRWGSSLRVKDGEVAVFVYKQSDAVMQDYIEGPFDETIKTKNLPVLASIVGLAYGGESPFQAEVYFINLARLIQTQFAVPYFDVYDPRFLDFGVPTAVRGNITFNISDYREFIKLHRLATFDLKAFQNQIRDAVARYVKAVVANVPSEHDIPVVQLEKKIDSINKLVEQDIRSRFENDFGVNLVAVDINAIDIDKTSDGYKQLKAVTQDITSATVRAQAEVNIKNIRDMQRINAENYEESLRIQRQEAQYAQHKQTQSANMDAFQLEQQTVVGIAGAEALGKMGASGATNMNGNGGFNPAAMMTGMAMGGAIGQNITSVMNGMMSGMNSEQDNSPKGRQPNMTPPPIPNSGYHVVINGKDSGAYDMQTISQMISDGIINKETLAWKSGMLNWESIGSIQELASLFPQNEN